MVRNVLIAGAFALASFASASPLPLVKRVGPSGQLVTPTDGKTFSQNEGIEIKYTRVNGDSGFYTEWIDVDLIDKSQGAVHRVATGLTSSDRQTDIDAWFAIPDPAFYPDNSGNTVQYSAQIIEHQKDSQGKPLQFVAANPSFTVQVVGGDSCAGSPEGGCGNTGR